MSTNNPSQNEEQKRQVMESMEHYLWINAEKILAERDAEKLEEIEKENLKSAYISEYQAAVVEARARFVTESKICDEIFTLIKPMLQETLDFAVKHSVFPPIFNETPIAPIQIFYKVETPRIKSDLNIYPYSTKENIVTEYQNRTIELKQKQVYGICGMEWGYGTYRYNLKFYGVKLDISPNGEVKIVEISFSIPDLNSKEFREALSCAFWAPVEFWNSYRDMSLFEDRETQQVIPKSLIKKLAFHSATFLHRARKNWKRLWDEPQFEINSKTSFLKKIWYGFTIEDEATDENDEY